MDTDVTKLFPLPETKVREFVTVELVDGTIVERTPDQLLQLPAGDLPAMLPATPAT